MKDYPEVQDEPLCKIVNGLKSFIFVAKNSNSNFVVELDTCRILLNYKILFYSSSLSITISSLNTFKWQNIVTFFLSQSKGEYPVFLQLLQNFFIIICFIILPVSTVSMFLSYPSNKRWIHRRLRFCFTGESGNVSLSLDDEFWFSFSLADSMTLDNNSS